MTPETEADAQTSRCDCGKTFSKAGNLTRHIRTQHNKNFTRFQCHFCRKAFQTKSYLNTHISQTHIVQRGGNLDDITDPEPASNPIDPLEQLCRDKASSIKTYFRHQRLVNIFNFRLVSQTQELKAALAEMWDSNIENQCKVQCSFGYVLRHRSNNDLRYFHSCQNNSPVLQMPRVVKSRSELMQLADYLSSIDWQSVALNQRPNSSWILQLLTNLTFYLTKLPFVKFGCARTVPAYLKRNKSLQTLVACNGRRYMDNLCFFRALALKLYCQCRSKTKRCRCFPSLESKVSDLFHTYAAHASMNVSKSEFEGVSLEMLNELEELFEISINVFKLKKSGKTLLIRSSHTSHACILNLNVYKHHFCYIQNLSMFSKCFECSICSAVFSGKRRLTQHQKCCAKSKTNKVYPHDCFRPPKTIYDVLQSEAEICVPVERQFYPFRATFDIECFMKPVQDVDGSTKQLVYSSKHELMSISVQSNVPGFDKPVCFVSEGNPEQLVDMFVTHLLATSECAYNILLQENSDILDALDSKITERNQLENPFESAKLSSTYLYQSRSLTKVKEKYLMYLSELPVIGFNSQRYDLNVIRGPLVKSLLNRDNITFAVRRESRMQCLKSDKLKFLDIMNYIAPGFSYEKYLKAFDCSAGKGFFPYDYIDSLDRLSETALPPHECFYSKLKQSNISPEDYQFCLMVWMNEGMTTLRDFLVWYNNLDVEPFLEAIAKQFTVYQSKGIDMFKDAISVPGLSVKWLFNETASRDIPIPLIDKKNSDLYQTIKQNIVGGPSIVFHRYHEKDKTYIRQHQFHAESKLCKQVYGFDANALYLWSTMQELPTGFLIRRRRENGFRAEFSQTFGQQALEWLEWTANTHNFFIQHKYNFGEKRIGQHGIPVDGFHESSKTVFQYHGCIFHGCPLSDCSITKGMTVNPKTNIPLSKLRERTVLAENYVRSLGFRLVSIQECEWLDFKRSDCQCNHFLDSFFDQRMIKKGTMSESALLHAIEKGDVYGLVECDLFVPSHLHEKFAEMTPIFKNIMVSRSDLPMHMHNHAQLFDHLLRPQRMLIGSYVGERVLVLTGLLRWYLSHGLSISRIYQVAQYSPKKPFQDFGLSVSSYRREGDVNPNKVVIAETAKLIGNSLYGKTITNKERHTSTHYTSSHDKAQTLINSQRFMSVNEIDNDVFEFEMAKKKITLDIPIIIGFSILQYAKLRMLSFYYDFIDKYFDRKDFQYVTMDTDSAYIAFSGNFEDVVRPELRREFFESYEDWFPPPFCPSHKSDFVNAKMERSAWQMSENCCKEVFTYHRRTPGLFKLEYQGTGIVALNSKTYVCFSPDNQKMSCKGISKHQNNYDASHFLGVLFSRNPVMGTNHGFRLKSNMMCSYSQEKSGISFFYAKRKVDIDGVTTSPLHR